MSKSESVELFQLIAMDVEDLLSGISKDQLSGNGDEDTTTEETYSAAQVLEKLETVWLNEKMAPEVLDHQMELVEGMMEQVNELETMIEQASKSDFRVSVHLMELDRVKFIVCDYLRCRLHKIEEFAHHINQDPLEKLKLTDNELKFAKGFWKSTREYLKEAAELNMPENVQNINFDKIEVRPNLFKYVILKADKPVTGVAIHEDGGLEEELVDFDIGDQQLVPYKAVQNLLIDNVVHLI